MSRAIFVLRTSLCFPGSHARQGDRQSGGRVGREDGGTVFNHSFIIDGENRPRKKKIKKQHETIRVIPQKLRE